MTADHGEIARGVIAAAIGADPRRPAPLADQVPDPVANGFVASLARPGGNTTGFTTYDYAASAKWVELLKEIAPGVTRAAVLRDPTIASGIGQLGAVLAVAPSLGIESSPIGVRDAGEIERAVTAFAREPNGGLIVLASPLSIVQRELIITLAAQHRLPAVYGLRFFVIDGGLISYGPDSVEPYRRGPVTLTASSRVRSPPTCQCRPRPSMNSSSTSRPPRRSVSTCRCSSSNALTRSSNKERCLLA
jgi:hypothetical protein